MGRGRRGSQAPLRREKHPKLAEKMAFATIAMPAISAGIFGFPKDRCAHIMVEEIAAKTKRSTGIGTIDIYLMDD